MPTEILMPALSPTMEEGTLAKWLVKEGDEVSSGDLLAEIETDKATMEFEAVDEGVVGKIMVEEGTEGVKVNTPIAVLLGDGEDASAIEEASSDGSSHVAPAEDTEATEPAKGYGRGPGAEDGGTSKDTASTGESASQPPSAPRNGRDGGRIFASPLARRIAKDRGLDLADIEGSGPHGRIVKADVENAEAKPAEKADPEAKEAKPDEVTPTSPKTAPAPAGPSADTVLKMYADREHEEVKLDGMRRTIAARLTEAKQTIPHFYLRRDIRLDALMAFRAQLNETLKPREIKLSVNDFIIKASALALQAVPDANAVWAGDRIVKLKPSDVAVAVAIEGGLFTPVLRDAHTKSLSTLSAEMKDLAARARDRKLRPEEYAGGSFAISNLGMFGIDNFDAVINPPHGSILAVGAGKKTPVVDDDGALATAMVMSVTLSVDHRVIDGALGAQFLQALIDNLEAPMAMLA
jgi:pyruvate dehydrogenase E2 component (dihydrolipoamide acetyltransferase)